MFYWLDKTATRGTRHSLRGMALKFGPPAFDKTEKRNAGADRKAGDAVEDSVIGQFATAEMKESMLSSSHGTRI